MHIKDWQVNYEYGHTSTCSKKCGDWYVTIHPEAVYLNKRRGGVITIPIKNNNLPNDFAKYLSEEDSAEKKIEKELTILKKIGRLYGIEII